MKTKSQILVAISYLAISAGADGQTQLKFWLPPGTISWVH
jgi:hypothetical protein